MKVYILLPCYNEENSLPYLLESIRCTMGGSFLDYEVIVINDGSQDNTEDVSNAWEGRIPITVINHERNMGLGRAVNTGLKYFNDVCVDDDVVVIMDGDNTHNPSLIPIMIENISKGRDVVIASRYEHGGEEIGLSVLRRLFSFVANKLLSLLFNIPGVRDYTCGYRAYSVRATKKANMMYGNNFIEEKGFTCMAEILIKLHFIGCDIAEVPLVLRYDLKKGSSKMKVLITIKRYFVLIFNLKHYKQSMAAQPAYIDGKEK